MHLSEKRKLLKNKLMKNSRNFKRKKKRRKFDIIVNEVNTNFLYQHYFNFNSTASNQFSVVLELNFVRAEERHF